MLLFRPIGAGALVFTYYHGLRCGRILSPLRGCGFYFLHNP